MRADKIEQTSKLIIISILVIASILCMVINSHALFNLQCKDIFPGTCSHGGCDADENWEAQNCFIKCHRTWYGWSTSICTYPDKI